MIRQLRNTFWKLGIQPCTEPIIYWKSITGTQNSGPGVWNVGTTVNGLTGGNPWKKRKVFLFVSIDLIILKWPPQKVIVYYDSCKIPYNLLCLKHFLFHVWISHHSVREKYNLDLLLSYKIPNLWALNTLSAYGSSIWCATTAHNKQSINRPYWMLS